MTPEALLVLHVHGTGVAKFGPPRVPVLTTCALLCSSSSPACSSPRCSRDLGPRARTLGTGELGLAYGALVIIQSVRGELAARSPVLFSSLPSSAWWPVSVRPSAPRAVAGSVLVASQLRSRA